MVIRGIRNYLNCETMFIFNNHFFGMVVYDSKSFWSLPESISQNFDEYSVPPFISENEIMYTLKVKAKLFAKQFALPGNSPQTQIILLQST